jgi:hypothetical protein
MTALADDLVPDELWALVAPLLPVPPRPLIAGARHRFLPTRNQVTSSPMPLTGIGPRRWNR